MRIHQWENKDSGPAPPDTPPESFLRIQTFTETHMQGDQSQGQVWNQSLLHSRGRATCLAVRARGCSSLCIASHSSLPPAVLAQRMKREWQLRSQWSKHRMLTKKALSVPLLLASIQPVPFPSSRLWPRPSLIHCRNCEASNRRLENQSGTDVTWSWEWHRLATLLRILQLQ